MPTNGFAIDLVSDEPDYLTSPKFRDVCEKMKATLNDVLNKRAAVEGELRKWDLVDKQLWKKRHRWHIIPFSEILLRKRNERIEAELSQRRTRRGKLETELQGLQLEVSLRLGPSVSKSHRTLVAAFASLAGAEATWDILDSEAVNQAATRSFASAAFERILVHFDSTPFSVVVSPSPILHFMNANGADIYFYPTFILVGHNETQFALLHYADVSIEYESVNFVEADGVPGDTRVNGSTWFKVNKDGSPDRRFKGNYEIPVVTYGMMKMKSPHGLSEAYLISNADAARNFVDVFKSYKQALLSK